jgi:hypothetical protein
VTANRFINKEKTDEFLQKLGANIRYIRTARGISIKQLSEIVGCEVRYLTNIENNCLIGINPKVLFNIIKHLDLVFYMDGGV